jgi:hypothetical protein
MSVDPTCVGDPVVGAHTCMSTHQIDTHGDAGKSEKGVHYMRACRLHNCACVCDCALDSRALEHAYKLSRRARVCA